MEFFVDMPGMPSCRFIAAFLEIVRQDVLLREYATSVVNALAMASHDPVECLRVKLFAIPQGCKDIFDDFVHGGILHLYNMAMDITDAHKLRALNNQFYRDNAQSFSATRATPWKGWDVLCDFLPFQDGSFSILDLACGNMRFERFLCDRFPQASFKFTALDSCEELIPEDMSDSFYAIDLLDLLLGAEPTADVLGDASFDLVVSFGFMHHVPMGSLRERFVDWAIRLAKPGGLAAFSFWRFMDDPKMSKRAFETTREARDVLGLNLEEGDYILGWNGLPGEYRYCHSFDREAIHALVSGLKGRAAALAVYDGDGREGNANTYVVMKRGM